MKDTTADAGKHTPGPWHVYRCSGAGVEEACGIASTSQATTGDIVGDCSYDECHHPMTLADARLGAAAPELLDALQYALSFIDTEKNNVGYGHAAADKIRAAIAKAEGRS